MEAVIFYYKLSDSETNIKTNIWNSGHNKTTGYFIQYV